MLVPRTRSRLEAILMRGRIERRPTIGERIAKWWECADRADVVWQTVMGVLMLAYVGAYITALILASH